VSAARDKSAAAIVVPIRGTGFEWQKRFLITWIL